MRRAAEAALILLLALPLSAGQFDPKLPAPLPRPLAGDPLKATIHRLSNGLTVYLSENHETPRINAWIAVRAGSKNDPAESTGLAHYLEHMLFKGTGALGTLDFQKEKPHLDKIVELYEKHYKAKDPAERERIYKDIDRENLEAVKYEVPNELDKIYRALGFRGVNAFTSDEQTVYVVDMPSNRVEAWAALESERFAHPVFRLFQSELEAVYEEKNRTLDNAERILGEALNKAVYKAHPYGQQTTIGSIEHLKNPSLKHMYEFYGRYYVPNNMALVLSGDFDTAKLLPLLESRFGAWKPQGLPAAKKWPLPQPKGTERVEVNYEAEEKVVIAWPTVKHGHPDADALSVMDMLMDNSVAGLINLELGQAQKVKAAGSFPTFYNEAGDWEMWAVPKRGQTLAQAEALLLETVEHLKRGDFTDEDIKAVITNFEVGEKSRLESGEARVAFMADSFIRQEPWDAAVARLDRLRKVTKADVLRVAKAYLGPNRVVAYRRNGKPELPTIAKPNFTKVDIDDARSSEFARKLLAMPAPEIEPRWLKEGRDYVVAKSKAGSVYAAKNPFNDLFQLSFVYDRGSRHERELCAALALLDLSGAGSMTAEQYKKKLFALGTSLSYGCGEQEASVTLTGLEGNLEESLRLMRQRFAEPAVDTDTLKKFVDVTIGAHADTKRDPQAVHGALGEWARRGKESSVLDELSDAELQKLELARLKDLMRGFPAYERRTGYVGTRAADALAALADDRKEYTKAPAHKDVKLLRPDTARVLFTHREMVQAQVGLYVADDTFDPTRSVDYSFLSSYLGGGMSSVIFQEIRESRSLAYAAWGGYAPASRKGDDSELYAGLGCQADKAPEATALLRQLVLQPPLSAERFAETRSAIEQNYRTNPIRFRSIPGTLMAWEDQGLPPGDPRPARFSRALTYTLEDLRRFAARFRNRPATLYVLGHRDRVGLEELKKLGAFEERPLDALFPY